jgi:hypothetical protein
MCKMVGFVLSFVDTIPTICSTTHATQQPSLRGRHSLSSAGTMPPMHRRSRHPSDQDVMGNLKAMQGPYKAPAALAAHEPVRQRAWELFCMSWPILAIAKELGENPRDVNRWVGEAMKQLAEQRKAYGLAYMERELTTLDLIERQCIEALPAATLDEQLNIMDRILKIKERRTKYLGMDAPTRQAVTLTTSLEDLVTGRNVKGEAE